MTAVTKTAFITGSGRRLGRQLAYAFAEAGYDIILHAHTAVEGMKEAEKAITSKGRNVLCTIGDLSELSEIKRIALEIRSAYDNIDVLINSAAVFPESSFDDVDEALWDRTIALNTKSVFFLSRELYPLLLKARGCIINIASVGAYESWLKHIPYNISKAATVRLTQALAKELAPEIRVNAIAPGTILVPGEEERKHIATDKIPLKRYGTIDDINDAALYLAEKAMYLTGHVLPVDGGMLGAT
jgi:pteridine reductase